MRRVRRKGLVRREEERYVGVLFISHSSRNNAEAQDVHAWLKANGYAEVFLDLDPHAGLAPGERWQSELKKAGEQCAAVVVLVSPEWLASDWCRTEFLLAVQLGKRIFPVLIKPTPFEALPRELVSHFQMADISDPATRESGYERLGIGLKRAGLDPSSFAWPPPGEAARNPYRGLEALDVQDAAVFFGRDVAITGALDLLRRMRSDSIPQLLVILGSSGAGKSSFLRAGLIARLRNDTENFIALPILRPGNAALSGPGGLNRVLGRNVRSADDIVAAFARERDKVMDRLARYAEATGQAFEGQPPSIVLPIDQAEEFYTAENREAEKAIGLIVEALGRDANAFAVATIRSDNYAELQTDPLVAELTSTLFNLGPMSHANFKAVIEGPARYATPPLRVEPALTEKLLGDLNQDDALPLLGFTLERLSSLEPAQERMTLTGYETRLGGLTGAIRKAVDQAFSEAREDPALPETLPELLALAQAAFIPWLVTLEAADADPRRRVAHLDEIPDEARPLVRHLVNHRLLVSATQQGDNGPTVTFEVAHEAILRRWPEVAGWIYAERDFLVGKSRLDQLLADWTALADAERNKGLASGVLLERARHWLIEHPDRFGERERDFIRRSDLAARAEEARRLRLQRFVTWGSAAAAAVFFVIGALAVWQWQEATEAKETAEAASLRAVEESKRAVAASEQAVKARDEAETALKTATESASNMVANLAQEFRGTDVPPSVSRAVLEEVRGLFNTLSKHFPDHSTVRQALERNYENLGDLLMEQGQTEAAQDIYRKGYNLAIARMETAGDEERQKSTLVRIEVWQAKMQKAQREPEAPDTPAPATPGDVQIVETEQTRILVAKKNGDVLVVQREAIVERVRAAGAGPGEADAAKAFVTKGTD